MKKKAIVTETVTYVIEFEVPDWADEDEIEDLAEEEWASNSGRKPNNYECEIEVKD